MAYSLIEQKTRDLDIFFKDSSKLIHITTAGGQIPTKLAENDIQNEAFLSNISKFEQIFEVEVNESLIEFISTPLNGIDEYLNDFVLMASRGFYSYDKTNLDNFEDPFFHLVARPVKFKNHLQNNETESLLKIEVELPTDFISFDLLSLINDK